MRKLFVGFMMCLLTACGGGGAGSNGNTASKTIAKMNITDAASLVIYAGSSTSAKAFAASTSSTPNRLFKITKDGYLLAVTFQDSNGAAITVQNEPHAVYNVNSSYVIVDFASFTYLVNKSTGSAYALDGFQSISGPYLNIEYKNIGSDKYGSIYYLSSGRVVKLDTTNPNAIIAKFITSDKEYISTGFNVDANGNIIYTGRVVAANGAVTNISSDYKQSWVAPDGYIYVVKSPWINGQGNIFKVNIDSNGNVSFDKYGEMNYGNELNSFLTLTDRVIGLCASDTYPSIFELFDPTNTPNSLPLMGLTAIKVAASSNSYYYVAGNDSSSRPVLLKIDPTTNTYSNLLPVGKYDVYKMSVSNDDNLVIYAMDMSNGSLIIGTISQSGTLKIVDNTVTSSTVILQPVN